MAAAELPSTHHLLKNVYKVDRIAHALGTVNWIDLVEIKYHMSLNTVCIFYNL